MTSVSLPESRTWHAISRSPARVAIGLIVVFSIYRLIVAATLGLGVDESYGIGVSHDLELSYFDHPPLHYWITHAFIPLLGDGRALRLPFIALFAATSWALYLLTRCLFNAVAGVWAVLALNLSMFFTIAGGWILPDGPLMLGLAAAAYMLASGLFPVAAPPSPSAVAHLAWRRILDRCCRFIQIPRCAVRSRVAALPPRHTGAAKDIAASGAMGRRRDRADHGRAGALLERRAPLGVVSLPRRTRGRLRRVSQIRAILHQSRRSNPLDGSVGVCADDRGHVLRPATGTGRRPLLVLHMPWHAGDCAVHAGAVVGRSRPAALANAGLADDVSRSRRSSGA